MEKYQFAFHSEIISYTSPYIGEVRKAIHRKVEEEKSTVIKNDIELHICKVHDGIPVLLNTCYLYDEKGCMVHGSIKGTKDYLLETWKYHTNRHSKGFSSTRIRPCVTSRAFSFVQLLRSGIMNQTLQLTDYIPQYVSLYYADYRGDLDKHEDIQEECIRSNNMEKLYEKVYEWYEKQESLNMHDYLEETRKNTKADNLAGEFERYEDEIRGLIYDRNDSDPVKDLIRNLSITNFFYSLGVEIGGYRAGCSLRGESVAMACHKVRRALHLKKGQFDEKIEELVENATYDGELRTYLNAMLDRLISKDPENDFKSIRFHGNVMVVIADSRSGSGHRARIPLDITSPFQRENLFVDSQVHYSYANEVCGMTNDWCDSTKWETGMIPFTGSARESRMAEYEEQEAAYKQTFRSRKYTFDDMNCKRHRDVQYSNEYPAGCRCPHCDTFWID